MIIINIFLNGPLLIVTLFATIFGIGFVFVAAGLLISVLITNTLVRFLVRKIVKWFVERTFIDTDEDGSLSEVTFTV